MSEEVERTGRTYDRVAVDYAAAWRERGVLQSHVERFLELVAPGSLVLDVGCGPGFDTAVLRRNGLRAVGLDRSWGMMQAGREHGVRADFVQVDMRRLPFAGRVDGLWVCASFLHLPRPDALATLRGFGRVLLPGGILYLSLKRGEGEKWSETVCGHRAARFFTYWQPETLDPLLATAGFKVIDGWTDAESKDAWLVRFARSRKI